MRNLFKRLVSGVVTLAVMSVSAVSAFAADIEANDNETTEAQECIMLTVTSEGITSTQSNENVPRSTISGYAYGYINKKDHSVTVDVEGSGIGGMGVTIRTSSSWNGEMRCAMFDNEGNFPFMNKKILSNGETYFNDLLTVNPAYYVFSFLDIPEGESVHVWIWVYG